MMASCSCPEGTKPGSWEDHGVFLRAFCVQQSQPLTAASLYYFVCVFVPHQLLNHLVDFMKFGWEVSQIFNPVAAAILKWLTLKLLRWMQILHQ
jgi:hypothetical protein